MEFCGFAVVFSECSSFKMFTFKNKRKMHSGNLDIKCKSYNNFLNIKISLRRNRYTMGERKLDKKILSSRFRLLKIQLSSSKCATDLSQIRRLYTDDLEQGSPKRSILIPGFQCRIISG